MPSLLRTDKEITEIYHRHVDSIYRVCYSVDAFSDRATLEAFADAFDFAQLR